MKTKTNQLLACCLAISKVALGLAFATVPMALAGVTVSNLDDSGPGSLRQAIADAPPGGTIDFTVTGTIILTSGELVITNDVSIAGPGPDKLTVSGDNATRVFSLTSPTSNVAISGLTIANGNGFAGGGINNSSYLTLTRCYLKSNRASDAGGAIANFNVCNITECTIAENVAAGNDGGGIYNQLELNATNSTIAFNQTPYAGGAIKVGYVGAITRLMSCTIANNSANSSAGGIWAGSGGGVNIRNSILANNTAPESPDGKGSFVSQDYNLIFDASGMSIGGSTTHNIYGQDPKLGLLANVGGPTPVRALRFDSPAVDAGSSGGLSTDQRGCARRVDSPDVANAEGGDGCDIGAYEMNPNMQAEIYTAVEFEFESVFGRNYRIESSTDLVAWDSEEEDIAGTGGAITRLYTVRAYPKKFFRAVRE